jgi:hypothetical protein
MEPELNGEETRVSAPRGGPHMDFRLAFPSLGSGTDPGKHIDEERP